MRFGILCKVLVLVIAAIAVTLATAAVSTFFSVRAEFEKIARKEVLESQKMADFHFQKLKKDLLELSAAQSTRGNVIAATLGRDADQLKEAARNILKNRQADQVLFTDASGTPLADAADRPVAPGELAGLRQALTGRANVEIWSGDEVKLALSAASPILKDGKVAGAVLLSRHLSRDNAFVEELKSLLGVEATIFVGDARASTTLEVDGKRAVGTRLDNQEILSEVLQRGRSAYTGVKLFQRDYSAAYWPIRNSDGGISGMLFLGKSLEGIANSQYAIIRDMVLYASVCAVLLTLVCLWRTRALVRPLTALNALAMKLAAGAYDERIELRAHDEIGDLAASLAVMAARIRERIEETESAKALAEAETQRAMRAGQEAEDARRRAESARCEGMLQAAGMLVDVSGVLSCASEQLSVQVEQATKGAQVQEERASQTARSMDQMNVTVLEVAKSASQAAETAEMARDKAEGGALIVGQVVEGIGEAQSRALLLKDDMGVLGRQAQGIGQVMEVISDIADQTNLLALNAAIEAARAGDAGRGFAVVADEVRKLAEKTMSATKEVGQAIQGIQQGTLKNVEHVERAVASIERATGLARQSGSALKEIVGLVDEASDQVRLIATASEQQSSASEEINRSVDDVHRIAGETTGAMRQSHQAVGEVRDQALTLNRLIEEMRRECATNGGDALRPAA